MHPPGNTPESAKRSVSWADRSEGANVSADLMGTYGDGDVALYADRVYQDRCAS